MNIVLWWWVLLFVISAFNIMWWLKIGFWFLKNKTLMPDTESTFRRRQLILSAFYVFGCAFRAMLPRIDVERVVMVNTWLSSIFIGRFVATVAELCFVAQIALTMHVVAKYKKALFVTWVSICIFPLIVIAEICSWQSVITTSYIGNTIEESIWTIMAVLIVVSLIELWYSYAYQYHRYFIGGILAGIWYIVFMVTVDVPTYASRWLTNQYHHKAYFAFQDGIYHAFSYWVVNRDINFWGGEMMWMTLYFSVAVWISILLIYIPLPKQITLQNNT